MALAPFSCFAIALAGVPAAFWRDRSFAKIVGVFLRARLRASQSSHRQCQNVDASTFRFFRQSR